MTEPTIPPELVPYLDEPPQHPSGAFGKDARLRLRFERRGDRSILATMDRRAPLLVQKALYCDEGMPHMPVVFIITNSGGVLQGDRYAMDFAVGPGACAHVTTQAATKIHEMDANHASQAQEIALDDGAYLEYLPEPVIPFARSRFLTRTRIEIAPTATLLYAETLMGGRKHYRDGETFRYDLFSSTVEAARPDGTPLFVEKFRVEPNLFPPARPGVMGDFDIFANVLLLTPGPVADAVASEAANAWNRDEGWAAGTSRLPNGAGLVYKIICRSSGVARTRIREFHALVRQATTRALLPPEYPWR